MIFKKSPGPFKNYQFQSKKNQDQEKASTILIKKFQTLILTTPHPQNSPKIHLNRDSNVLKNLVNLLIGISSLNCQGKKTNQREKQNREGEERLLLS